LDGLARVSGVLDIYDRDGDKFASGFTFAVTVFAPKEGRGHLSLEELGQLFHDMNFKQTSVAKAHALALDRSDIHTILTNEVGSLPVIKRAGGMEVRAASLGKKSTALVVQQVLRRFVRGATEGKTAQMDDKYTPSNPHLTAETREFYKQEIEFLLEGLSTRMGEKFQQRDSLHLTSAGWQAIGLVFHDIIVRLKGNLTADERDTILTGMAVIDWGRHNPDWIPKLGQPELDAGGTPIADEQGRFRVALGRGGRQTVWTIADYIREKSILGRLLESRASEDFPIGVKQAA
jgi:DNA-sulfur modification-associated